jgi:phosphoglycerate dehydrogenase-like enzyme
MVTSEEEMRAQLPRASALVVESFRVGSQELQAAPNLRILQKFGQVTRNIDVAACEQRGITLRTQRRRANIACAEHTFAIMLDIARRIHRLRNRISPDALREAGYQPGWFGTGHTSIGGWARVANVGMLYESTLGILGMGEIGREMALRGAAFGMRNVYYQRTPLNTADEAALQAEYKTLEALLAESDWVVVTLPFNQSTRDFIGREQIAQMKPGAAIVNISPAAIVNRDAVLDGLRSGHLGGFGVDMLYESPGRDDDEMLTFENAVITPHIGAAPRHNALRDLREVIVGIAGDLS